MEWHIMNVGGINSLSGSLGSVEDGEFVPSQHCEDSLSTLLSQIKDEDAAYRNVRRQVFYNKIVETELMPMLKHLKDDITLYALVIKLMSVLTQPVECLVNASVYSTVPSQPVHIPWQRDLETSLRAYRKLCIDEELLYAVMTEVQTILTDNEGCRLSEESCDVITDVLLLLRNLLHLPEENEDSKQNQEQELFLRMLFQCGLTDRVMSLLNLREREVWSVPMVQMISLLYKGHVGEMFCKGLEMEESAMNAIRYDEFENDVFSKFEHLSELGNDMANNLCIDPETDQSQNRSKPSSESSYSVKSSKEENDDRLRKDLLNFTHQFLEKGFSSLVNDLKYILINRKKIVLDDVYLLWLIAFFLKFARCQKVPLKTIRTVFSTKIFGFLVYEGVSNLEYLLIAQRKKQDLANTLRRIHMTVDALREMLQFLKICQENTELEEDDIIYLDRLKGDLTDMYDLRQFFLLLTRYFQLHIHSLKFLCDVVVTNHLFLLLMEMWMNGGLVRRNFNMLDHIRQFATVEVMKNYGVLVENVQYNNLMVNNCLFTMMHHVAGDCGKPEVLLQVHILKTFLDISEKDIIMTQEMEDLIEYVLQTFVLAAENNPLTCAMQLFGEDKQQATAEQSSSEQSVHEDGSKMMSDGESDTDKWTEEEEDILMMLYTEYQEDCDFAQKIRSKLEDFGIEKSVDEIVVYLTALGWIPSEHKEKISSEEDSKSKSTCEMDHSEKPLEDSDNKDLSSLKESEVIPYCIKQLNKDGFDSCVEWLKMQFCEVAYTKYVSMYNITTSQETEEPIAKHYVAQNKSVPLVHYNELQEHVIHNKHFVRLISNLGLHMPEDVGMIFPRIPHWWSIQHLVDSARQLGGNPIDLKFDLTALKQESDVQSEVTDVRMEDPITCNTHTHLNSYKRLPNTMWMDVIQQINKTLVNEKVYGEDSKNGDNKNGCLEQIALQVNKADRTSAMECGE